MPATGSWPRGRALDHVIASLGELGKACPALWLGFLINKPGVEMIYKGSSCS